MRGGGGCSGRLRSSPAAASWHLGDASVTGCRLKGKPQYRDTNPSFRVGFDTWLFGYGCSTFKRACVTFKRAEVNPLHKLVQETKSNRGQLLAPANMWPLTMEHGTPRMGPNLGECCDSMVHQVLIHSLRIVTPLTWQVLLRLLFLLLLM